MFSYHFSLAFLYFWPLQHPLPMRSATSLCPPWKKYFSFSKPLSIRRASPVHPRLSLYHILSSACERTGESQVVPPLNGNNSVAILECLPHTFSNNCLLRGKEWQDLHAACRHTSLSNGMTVCWVCSQLLSYQFLT